MSDKHQRHQVIRDIVAAKAVASQEELRRQLAKRGWDVTQSTLSRDLRELRLARIPDAQGHARYAFSDPGSDDDERVQLERMLPQLLTHVEGVQVLVVARTIKSGAHKAHLLVSCKFSGSIPKVSDSALTIELPNKCTKYSGSP